MNIPTFIGEIPIFTYMEVTIRGCHPKRSGNNIFPKPPAWMVHNHPAPSHVFGRGLNRTCSVFVIKALVRTPLRQIHSLWSLSVAICVPCRNE